MKKLTVPTVPPLPPLPLPLSIVEPSSDPLGDVLRQGAQRMLVQAIEAEVQTYLSQREHLRDGHGRQQVVRNGYLPERRLQTPVGPLTVRQPRVRDRRDPEDLERFTSAILPPYLRRTRPTVTTSVTARKRTAGDRRLPPPGAAIVRKYKGRTIRAVVLEEGQGFECDGERFRTLSALAKNVTGSHMNGFRFFQLGSQR